MTGLKILSIATGMPDTYDSMWRRIFSIANGLRKQGNEVELISYVSQRTFDRMPHNFTDPCHLVCGGIATVFQKNVEMLRRFKPDLLFVNTHKPAIIPLISNFGRIPLVLDIHGAAIEEIKMLTSERGLLWGYRQLFLHTLLERLALSGADRINCVSKKMITYLSSNYGISSTKMQLITNGIDLEFFRKTDPEKIGAIKKRLGLVNKFVFGYIGSIQKWQGMEEFIEATRLTRNDDIRFLVIGGLKSGADGNLIQYKNMSREQLLLYYSLCDVLVLPRPRHIVTEVAAPTKFAEYTAMSKPVLTTNVGDAADFVRKYECGLVVNDNSPKSLRDGFLAFKKLSAVQLENMGANSRKLAESEFDWTKILTKLSNDLDKLH